MYLSFVIPVFNESGVIGQTMHAVRDHAEALGRGSFEVVLVDDGSRDDSVAEMETTRGDDERFRIERLGANRGKGAAVREGVLRSKGDYVFFLDADLSTPLEEVERFLPLLEEGADFVLGNRKARESQVLKRQPKWREMLGRAFTLFARVLLAPPIQDFTCGFKGFRREAAHAVFERSTLDGWAFDAELVVIARCLGYRIEQRPVTWINCPSSKVRVVTAVFGAGFDLLRLTWRRVVGTYARQRKTIAAIEA